MLDSQLNSATDNAKELILKKINADTNWSDIYTISLMLGDDLETIGNLMIDPDITKLLQGYESTIFDQYAVKNKITYIKNAIASTEDETLKDKYKKLLYLAEAAEETKILGRMLKINQGMPTNTTDMYSYIKGIEKYVESRFNKDAIDKFDPARKKYSKLKKSQYAKEEEIQEALKQFNQAKQDLQNTWKSFDLIRFINDENYKQQMIEQYEAYKIHFNILDTISRVPHFRAMFSQLGLNNDVTGLLSKRKNIEDHILNTVLHQDQNDDEELLYAKLDKNEIAHIKDVIDKHIRYAWINSKQLVINIPQNALDNTHSSYPLYLETEEDIEKFVQFMEKYVIPKLKEKLPDNDFVKMLTFGLKDGQPFYRLGLNMLQVDNTVKTRTLYDKALTAFNDLNRMTVEGINDAESGNNHLKFGDLFYLYNLIVNKDKFGANSMTRIFEDLINNTKGLLVHDFNYWIDKQNYKEIMDIVNSVVEEITNERTSKTSNLENNLTDDNQSDDSDLGFKQYTPEELIDADVDYDIESESEPETPDDNGIVYNEEQKAAIKGAIEFINSDSYEPILINGKAGTGKTTIVNAILKEVSGIAWIAALSHKAKKVLWDKVSEKNKINHSMDAKTIAQLTNRQYDPDTGEFVQTIDPNSEGSLRQIPEILIIDEASMIKKEDYEFIKKFYIDKGCKVIFLGDSGQLPPIDEDSKNKDDLSVVFDLKDQFKLITRIRQGEDSVILPYADIFWNYSHGYSEELPRVINNKSSIKSEGALIFNPGSVGYYNGKLVLNHIQNDEKISNIIALFKKAKDDLNDEYAKIVVFRNDARIAWNDRIHNLLFKKDGVSVDNFNRGEQLIFNNSYVGTDSKGKPFGFYNSDTAVVEEIGPLENYTMKVRNIGSYDIKRHKLKVRSGKEVFYIYVCENMDMKKDALVELSKWRRILRDMNITKFSKKELEQMADELLKAEYSFADIDYGYAITSHKAQGSTYDIVVVDAADIMGSKKPTMLTKTRSMYTALTRSRNVTIVYGPTTEGTFDGNYNELNDKINANKRANEEKTKQAKKQSMQQADPIPMYDTKPSKKDSLISLVEQINNEYISVITDEELDDQKFDRVSAIDKNAPAFILDGHIYINKSADGNDNAIIHELAHLHLAALKSTLLYDRDILHITPIQAVDKKASIKAKLATQFIGYGEGIANSSTEHYRKQAGNLANTGNYSDSDVIFVSVPGRRGDEKLRSKQQDRTIEEAIKAIESGATLLTDNKDYIFKSWYNEGELKLYNKLRELGYNYSEKIIDGETIGVWSKDNKLERYYNLLSKVRQTEIYAKLASTAKYANKVGSDLDEEVLATIISNYYSNKNKEPWYDDPIINEIMDMMPVDFRDVIENNTLLLPTESLISNYAVQQKIATYKNNLWDKNELTHC